IGHRAFVAPICRGGVEGFGRGDSGERGILCAARDLAGGRHAGAIPEGPWVPTLLSARRHVETASIAAIITRATMRFADDSKTIAGDSPEARRYNRVRRWLEIGDIVLSLGFLLALLLLGWTSVVRDWAYRAAFQNYGFAVLFYVLLLMVMAKLLSFGLDYFGYRLEQQYHLSNQRMRAWLWDEVKGFLVGFVVAVIVAELLYLTIRHFPEYWWLVAW